MPKDEAYILDLCDRVLGRASLRQHRFEFLRGDTGSKLPVDAFYPDLRLAIEYHEVQHTNAVPFMDRRMTVSGIPRGEQRKRYDDVKRKVLPANGVALLILDYTEFGLNSRKRLRRDHVADEITVKDRLRAYLDD